MKSCKHSWQLNPSFVTATAQLGSLVSAGALLDSKQSPYKVGNQKLVSSHLTHFNSPSTSPWLKQLSIIESAPKIVKAEIGVSVTSWYYEQIVLSRFGSSESILIKTFCLSSLHLEHP